MKRKFRVGDRVLYSLNLDRSYVIVERSESKQDKVAVASLPDGFDYLIRAVDNSELAVRECYLLPTTKAS